MDVEDHARQVFLGRGKLENALLMNWSREIVFVRKNGAGKKLAKSGAVTLVKLSFFNS